MLLSRNCQAALQCGYTISYPPLQYISFDYFPPFLTFWVYSLCHFGHCGRWEEVISLSERYFLPQASVSFYMTLRNIDFSELIIKHSKCMKMALAYKVW